MLARPPIQFLFLTCETPCRAREAACASFEKPPASEAPAAAIPRTVFALMAWTSEITPCAALAKGAVTGMKLATVSAIGATFLIPLHTFEKKPGFLQEDFSTVPFSATVSFRLCLPILISDWPGPALTVASTSWSFLPISASLILATAWPGTLATFQSSSTIWARLIFGRPVFSRTWKVSRALRSRCCWSSWLAAWLTYVDAACSWLGSTLARSTPDIFRTAARSPA